MRNLYQLAFHVCKLAFVLACRVHGSHVSRRWILHQRRSFRQRLNVDLQLTRRVLAIIQYSRIKNAPAPVALPIRRLA